jgi:hypothetical protein
MKWLNRLGLYKRTQYKALIKERDALVKKNSEIRYDFDELLTGYTSEQLNALVYKAIQLCYNDPNKKALLERWYIRLNGIFKKD